MNIDKPDTTFLSSGLYTDSILQGYAGTEAVNFSVGTTGAITVQPGAVIDTTQSLDASGNGGYVALIGATGVTNAGTIVTQNGQIILAGGSATKFGGPWPSGALPFRF